jgi:branched-chain amino acid transport system permease protein
VTEFLIQTLHGLTLGALFALVAVGYTMVYGIIKLINFAHGEFYMVGGFTGLLTLLFLTGPGRPFTSAPGELKLLISLLAAGLIVALLAVLTERWAYRPLRQVGRISALLTAVGVSLLLQNIGITATGGRSAGFAETIEDELYPRYAVDLGKLQAGEIAARTIVYRAQYRDYKDQPLLGPGGKPLQVPVTLAAPGQPIDAARLKTAVDAKPIEIYAYPAVTIHKKQIFIFVALAVSALLLYLMVQHTQVGRAMRAVSHDMQAASLMGIDCSRIVSLTFGVGGMLAGIGGVLAGGMFISAVDPLMGFMFGLKAFIAAVLGGIGSIPGALLGGLVLGLIEQYAQYYADIAYPGAGAYRDAIAFVILIGILLIRPRGFFGRIEGEKV